MTPEQIEDREAQRIVDFIRARFMARAEHVDVTKADEPIVVAGAVMALAEIAFDIEARRHRRLDAIDPAQHLRPSSQASPAESN